MLAAWCAPKQAQAETQLAIEISGEAEAELDLKLVRRLIALEIADVDVPVNPASGSPQDVALFFRVLKAEPRETGPANMLSVELWELGVLHGTRRVSTGESQRLTARRVAQAAAQLVLGLRKRRLAESRKLKREAARLAREAKQPKRSPLFARLTLDVPARAAWVGGDAWLAGVALSPALRFDSGPRIGLGFGLMAGAVADAGALRWLELSLTPGYDFELNQDKLGLGVGVTLGAAAVQLSNTQSVDDTPGQRTTWSARATLDASLDVRLSAVSLSFGPEAGALLRPLRYEPTGSGSASQTTGGLWLGGSVSLRIDPPGGL